MTDSHKSPEQLEREVESARRRVDATVEAITNRLSPGEMLDEVLTATRTYGGDVAGNLSNQVRRNPLAAVLTGIGVTWLMAGGGAPAAGGATGRGQEKLHAAGQKLHGAGQAASDKLHGARDAAGDAADRVKGAAASAAESVRGAAHDASDQVAQAGRLAAGTFEDLMSQFASYQQQQPLVVGALGVALGAALGAILPPTDFEDDAIGSESDQAVKSLESEATEGYERAREKVGHVPDEA